MMFIDAREGVSGDMLLAAMLGMLTERERDEAVVALASACSGRSVEMSVLDVEEAGERGLSVAYVSRRQGPEGASRNEAYGALAEVEAEIGSRSTTGRRILDAIMEAEAKAHEVPVHQVHLHEIARAQAMVNIAGIGLVHSLLERAGHGEFAASTITTGRGIVVVGHGAVRIPAPACRFLLEGMLHQPGDSPGERATPVGVAAVKVLASRQTDDIPVSPLARSVGFGTRRFGGRLGRVAVVRT